MATITVTDLAQELDTDARTARKFLRTVTPKDEQPGKGKRWSIEKREVRSLKSKFRHYTEEVAKAAAEKASKVEAPAEEVDEEDINDSADAEPTAEELAAIDCEGDADRD